MNKKRIFYVATNGDDSFSGKLSVPNKSRTDGPFASITKARDAIRKLKKAKGLKKPITVMVRKGTYFLDKTIVFTPEDSGTEKYPITYRGYPGEKVTISGGKVIKGKWKKYSKNIWTIHLPEVEEERWYFRQLFVNGKRQTRARTPNKGFFYIAGVTGEEEKLSFKYKKDDLRRWSNLQDVEVIVFHSWDESRLLISKLGQKANDVVTFRGPSKWAFCRWAGDERPRYYVENVFEGLDSPGEWYLNRRNGNLYHWPMSRINLERAEVIAPVLNQLILFKGNIKKKEYVHHIKLSNFTFSHTDWSLPGKGYPGGWGDKAKPSAITLEGVEYCSLENNLITNVGTYALEVSGYENRIAGNEITETGSGGIFLHEYGSKKKKIAGSKHNAISHNHIHHCGIIYPSGVAIVNQTDETTISHNLIHDMPYCGIAGGGSSRGIIIEYNEIYRVMQKINDGGGIYCAGPGSIIRNNLIHDVFPYKHRGWGIYLDDYNEDVWVENNIVYRTLSGGLMLHQAVNNVITNNIFALAKEGQIYWTRYYGETISGAKKLMRDPLNKFKRNIVYWKEGYLSVNLGIGRKDLVKKPELIDYNLYYNISNKNSIKMCYPKHYTWRDWKCDDSFKKWQRAGFDKHSLISDPLFVDPEKEDFTLSLNSPAFKLGFKPIDTSKIGLKR